MLTVASVEEREVKLEAVLLQALKRLILRVARVGVKRHGLHPAISGARGWLRGAALSMVVTRLRSLLRVAAGRLPVENPGREEASWAPSTAFTVEALDATGGPPAAYFSAPGPRHGHPRGPCQVARAS